MASVFVQAPARVNIIGEHTDYSGGFVLPMTTALYTRMKASQRPDSTVELISRTLGETRSFSLERLVPATEPGWQDYVRGVAAELVDDGVKLKGAIIEIETSIPLGAGLSSSASLELAAALVLLAISGASIEATRLAVLCRRAEQGFAGVQCGIMDQYAVACALKGHAILLDCRTMAAEQVAIPEGAVFLLADSGIRHQLPAGDYNDRAAECREALQRLRKSSPAPDSLRDLSAEALETAREYLGDTLHRRCRHILTENQRVHAAVEAMRSADLGQLGTLLNASHASLRDDFEVTCEETDTLAALCQAAPGVLGARQMGGGFGGCVLSLTRSESVGESISRISEGYARVSGAQPWIHVVEPADPAKIIEAAW